MFVSPTADIQVSLRERVLEIRLARPARKNAISLHMYSAMADAFAYADTAPEVRAVLLAGSEGIFTAGNDLADFMNNPVITDDHPTVRFINAMRFAEKPVVAQVEGIAIGIGATLLQHVDFAYASKDARIQMPFVNLGLAPENAASLYLSQMVGRHRANRLLLLGEAITGEDAAEWGLITAAYDKDTLYSATESLLSRLVAQPPSAMKRAKVLLRGATQLAENAALDWEYRAMTEGLNSEEAKEALTAFYEKRQPDFSRF